MRIRSFNKRLEGCLQPFQAHVMIFIIKLIYNSLLSSTIIKTIDFSYFLFKIYWYNRGIKEAIGTGAQDDR